VANLDSNHLAFHKLVEVRAVIGLVASIVVSPPAAVTNLVSYRWRMVAVLFVQEFGEFADKADREMRGGIYGAFPMCNTKAQLGCAQESG
jgi:hypothetical protein